MKRPGFYFCICPDAGLIREHVDVLSTQWLPASQNDEKKGWERHLYWGDEDLGSKFWEHLTLQGLFQVPRVLVLRQAQNLNIAQWKSLSTALSRPHESSFLIICLEGVWEKKQPKIPAAISKQQCFSFANKQGWVWRHAGLQDVGVKQYIQAKAQSLGLAFDKGVLEAFCQAVSPDALSVNAELHKLSLAAHALHKAHDEQAKISSVNITQELLKAWADTSSFIPEADIFSFISHVESGNVSAAWREIYRSQKDVDALLFPFLTLLTREMRLFWQILTGEGVQLPAYLIQKKQPSARKLGHQGITKVLASLVQAEYAVKSGAHTAEQALEILITGLVRLFSR